MIKKITVDEVNQLFNTLIQDYKVTFLHTGRYTFDRVTHPKSYKTISQILEKARLDLEKRTVQFDQATHHITYHDVDSHYYFECENEAQFLSLHDKFLKRSIDYRFVEYLYS